MPWSANTHVSKDFTLTRTEIIGAALRKLGAFDHGEAIPWEEENDAAFALNVLLKEWTARGIDIFVRQQITLVLDPLKSVYYLGRNTDGSQRYPNQDDLVMLGNSSASHLTQNWTYGQTTINTTKGKGPVWVTAATDLDWLQSTRFAVYGGFTNAMVAWRPDAGSSRRWCWSRCTAVNQSGEVDDEEAITFTVGDVGGESGDTASIGNDVRFAEGRVVADAFGGETGLWRRPVDILYAHRRDPHNGFDVPVNLIGEKEYQRLSRKHQTGPTTNVWYKPMDEYGELYVWPTGDDNYTDLVMQCRFHVDDMDTVSDNPAFPIEWANAIIFCLAHDLAPEYGVDQRKRIEMYTIGQGKLETLLDHSQENANVVFTIDNQRAR
jgi:hypothetical protein